MTTTRSRLVEELFQAACDLPLEERAPFLDEECGGNATLRAEVEGLLRHQAAAPADFLVGRIANAPPPHTPDLSGRKIERFEIVRKIGEGGMGAVYEARQEHPRRSVALKLIRPERSSPEMLRRFRHEADVLAGLLDPGIAQVYEAGTAETVATDGTKTVQPYFAMELVEGKPLDEHARDTDARAKVELVARICDAVQHAHQRGIIHRDLKPDNILVVEEGGGVGQPKVLDFGIARVARDEARQSTLETKAGHLVGTLEYMSPEQVGGDPFAVDTRSDVYALGTILFELLAGKPPLQIQDLPLLEAARRIRDELPTSLRSLRSEIPTELDWICAKALEKDKEDRYPSAGDLAADLRRFLMGEPIVARSHSTFYVMRKTLRRHRGLALAALSFLALLTAFAVVSGIQAEVNRRLARSAQEELTISNIERGRLFGLTDNYLGEPLLWRAFLRDPDSPHAFWALWEFYQRHPRLMAFTAHDHEIREVELAPDGSWLATASLDGLVKLWDSESYEELAVLEGAEDALYSMSVAPDGSSLAAGSLGGPILIWDRDTLELASSLQGHNARVEAMDHHPGGSRLASASFDGTARVWDSDTEECVSVLEHGAALYSVCYSPDGELLATGCADGVITLWEEGDGPAAGTLEGHTGAVTALAFSSDGRYLYSGAQDRDLIVWDLSSALEVRRLHPENGTLRGVRTSDDGTLLWVFGWKRVDFYALPSLEPIQSVPLDWAIYSAALQESEDRIVIGTIHGLLRGWDLNPGRGVRRFSGHEGRTVVGLSGDGSMLATGDEKGLVRIWDVERNELLATFQHTGRVACLRFDPAGGRLASGSMGELRVWDVSTGGSLFASNDFSGKTNQGLDFSDDGALLAGACAGSVFRVWRTKDWAEIAAIDTKTAEALAVRLQPVGAGVATISRNARVQLWSLDGELRGEFPSPRGGPWNIDFTPDGEKLFAGTWTHEIQVWDVPSRKLDYLFEGNRGTVWTIRLSPGDSDLLVSGSEPGTVRIWSREARRNVATLTPFGNHDVISVALSDDGRTLAASGAHPGVVVWDLDYPLSHMARNLRHQLETLGPELGDEVPREQLLRWADEVRARPWPRWAQTER